MKISSEKAKSKKIQKVLFIGSKKLGLKCLVLMEQLNRDVLIGAITIDDSDDTRTVYQDFKKFAKIKKINLFTVKNKKEFNNLILKLRPEFCLVASWYWLIDNEILANIPHGSVGLHGSLLPKYRGGSPAVWAIINGEKETGISLFSFAEGMDNGMIWAQRKIPIKESDYIDDILKRIEDASLDIIRKNYSKILNHDVQAKRQDHRRATYCAQRIAEDGLIDWRKSAREIYNFIRAQSHPYPGAFSKLEGKKLIIWRTRIAKEIYYGTPGQVAKIKNGELFIICGNQQPLILEKVQLEGQAEVAPGEIIKSIKARLG